MNLVAVLLKNNIQEQIKILKKYQKYFFAVEIRIDTFYPTEINKISNIIKKLTQTLPKIKIILTFRSKNEGGKIKINESLRKKILLELIKKNYKYIDFLDIEYNSKIKKEIAKIVKNYNKTLIISSHFFKEEKPKNIKKTIKNIRKFANLARCKYIIKIVILSNNFKYYFNILKEIYQADNFKNITFFTMGKISLISRSIAVLLNMPLVYVATKKPVISTQPDLKQIINILSKMGLI